MFELSIAAKYLLPRWRRLSLSLISMIAIGVISLVVWLILVFFSVTNGVEKMWIEKLIVLTGPARIYPTDAYYKSYYHLIDSISSGSNYQTKSIEEKLYSTPLDPWNPAIDEAIPDNFPPSENKDLLKELMGAIHEDPLVDSFIYEAAPAAIQVRLDRLVPQEEGKRLYTPYEGQIQQNGIVLSLDTANTSITKNLLPLSDSDKENLFKVLSRNHLIPKNSDALLKTPSYGWILPKPLYPAKNTLKGTPIYSGDTLRYYLLKEEGTVSLPNGTSPPLVVPPNTPVQMTETGIQFQLQGHTFKGPAPLYELDVAHYEPTHPLWMTDHLPSDPTLGDGILLPKSFLDAGALVGDRGYLLYEAPSLAATSQVQLPVFVAGFYDPGLMAMGGKFILATPEVASLIRSSMGDAIPESNGIQLRYPDYTKIHTVKARLEKRLAALGLSPYFKVETYEEYDFAKGFIQELKSQKNVFLILAGMIILVACSNIISMLIILVNDKKKEIGILRALGARTVSIGAIFGLIGLSMGVIGSLLGIALALLTLHFLPSLIVLLGRLQGFDAFQRLFYNNTFPSELSLDALQFVLIATTLTSLLAALIPAIKACLVKPAAMLRSE